MRLITTKQVDIAISRLSSGQINKVEFIAEKFFELSPIEQQFVFTELEHSTEALRVDAGFIEYDKNLSMMVAKGLIIREIRGIFERKRIS